MNWTGFLERRFYAVNETTVVFVLRFRCIENALCPRSRLRTGEGLHHARLHAEAGKPLPDAVAAPILLPVPQPRGVEGGGRVAGKSASLSTQYSPAVQCNPHSHLLISR